MKALSIRIGDFKMGWFCCLLAMQVLGAKIDWIDVPKVDCKEIFLMESSGINDLNALIADYHAIEKTALEKRIESLDKIRLALDSLSQNYLDCESASSLFKQRILAKKHYLEELRQMLSPDAITAYHLDVSSLQSSKWTPLFLRNDRSYSLKMGEFWGEFWLESIDPCHRRLAHYYQLWLDTNPPRSTRPGIDYFPFFLWLESQPLSKDMPKVEYYSNEKLAACHVAIKEGYLIWEKTGKKISTDPLKRNLFVIDLSENLYLESFKDGVWHTSLSQGKPVLGAGLLQIEEGVIQTISLESGHYFPSLKQGFQTIEILRGQGALFQEPFYVIYFEQRKKYRTALSQEDIQDGFHFEQKIHNMQLREVLSTDEF